MIGISAKGYEVHARRHGNRIVFKIWNIDKNVYPTGILKSQRTVIGELIRFETERIDFEASQLKNKIIEDASQRVIHAKKDGFESPFVTSGELDDDWKAEGEPIIRGI